MEQERADYRTAALMSVVMNAFTPRTDKRAHQPSDFYFYFRSL